MFIYFPQLRYLYGSSAKYFSQDIIISFIIKWGLPPTLETTGWSRHIFQGY